MLKSEYSKKLLNFFFILLALGFILGTFTLQLLVRSVAIYIRSTGWFAGYEIFIVILIMIAFLFYTFLFAKWLAIWFTRTKDASSKTTFIVILIILVCITIGYWLKTNDTLTTPLISANGRFTAGPYPDTTMLSHLKVQGHTTIISLLDPLVLPDEAFLIEKENRAAAALGLKLIRIPLLPGNVENLEAKKQIEAIVNTGNNKYYVHSNNDQDRILTFMNIVDKHYQPTQVVQRDEALNRYPTITLERGTAVQLDMHIIVSPKPTNKEFMRYFLNTPNSQVKLSIRSVVSFDLNDQSSQSNDILKLLKEHGINYYVMPIISDPYDPETVLSIVKKIKSLSGGVLVYSYYMPPLSIATSAFILSYLTNLPALPKGLFTSELMHGGEVKIIAPNVATGPRPTQTEFNDYLKIRGIKSIGFAGPCMGSDYSSDAGFANSANLKWVCLRLKDDTIYQVLDNGGPWYVYGPALPKISAALEQRLSKFMPDRTLLGE